MFLLLMLAVALTGAMAVFAYSLAIHALPVIVAITVARIAHATGAGIVGAGVVELLAGVASFGLMVFLFAALRSPILRLAVAIVFALPAAVAGYSLVHGVVGHVVPSEIWRQFFSIAGGIFVGCSALARLADPSIVEDGR
mgnify:CR=1 FL=1